MLCFVERVNAPSIHFVCEKNETTKFFLSCYSAVLLLLLLLLTAIASLYCLFASCFDYYYYLYINFCTTFIWWKSHILAHTFVRHKFCVYTENLPLLLKLFSWILFIHSSDSDFVSIINEAPVKDRQKKQIVFKRIIKANIHSYS